MNNNITYLKIKRRMPIRVLPVIYPRDYQQDLPVNWCVGCRRELYTTEETLCRRCKGVRKEYEENKSLPEL